MGHLRKVGTKLREWHNRRMGAGSRIRVRYQPVGFAEHDPEGVETDISRRGGLRVEGRESIFVTDPPQVQLTIRFTQPADLLYDKIASPQGGGGFWQVTEVFLISEGAQGTGGEVTDIPDPPLPLFGVPEVGFSGEEIAEAERTLEDQKRELEPNFVERAVREINEFGASLGVGFSTGEPASEINAPGPDPSDFLNLDSTTKLLVGVVALAVIAFSVQSVLE